MGTILGSPTFGNSRIETLKLKVWEGTDFRRFRFLEARAGGCPEVAHRSWLGAGFLSSAFPFYLISNRTTFLVCENAVRSLYPRTYILTYIHTETETETETRGQRSDRQTDRQPGRQAARQPGSQAGRQTGRQADRRRHAYNMM